MEHGDAFALVENRLEEGGTPDQPKNQKKFTFFRRLRNAEGKLGDQLKCFNFFDFSFLQNAYDDQRLREMMMRDIIISVLFSVAKIEIIRSKYLCSLLSNFHTAAAMASAAPTTFKRRLQE